MNKALHRIVLKPAARHYPSMKEHDTGYNILPEEAVNPVWNVSGQLTPLSEEEFSRVASLVHTVLRKYGVTAPPPPYKDIDFFLVEEGYFDRTVTIEIIDFVRFWEIALPLLRDLCDGLKAEPLWRVFFTDYSSDSEDNAILVYPDGVRVEGEGKAGSVTERVVQIAEAKLHAWSQREHHRRQRRRELAVAIPKAFEQLETNTDPVVFVAAFDTISYPLRDTASEEGQNGCSIALLFRNERDESELPFTTEPSGELGDAYFATPEGTLLHPYPSIDIPTAAKLLLDYHPPGDTIALCYPEGKWRFGNSGKIEE